MSKTTIYVTKEGYKQYLDTLAEYRKEHAALLKTRSEYGKNETENYQTGVYDSEEALIISSINNLVETIKSLTIIEDTNAKENTVNMNDIVNILMLDFNETKRIQIVGGVPDLSNRDELAGITINSPLGKAIYKKKIGDTVSYTVGKNTFNVIIMSKEKPQAEKTEVEKQPLAD